MHKQRQVGIYAGTFDPIHNGHLAFAAQAMHQCALDAVVFLPEPSPRGKQHVTSIVHRVALIQLAIETEPRFNVLKLNSGQFTIKNTLPKLQQEFGDALFTFLIGSDVAVSLGSWPSIKTLLQRVSLAIGIRESDEPLKIAASMKRLSQEQAVPVRYTLVLAAHAGVSSSKLRAGLTNSSQLPASVLAYMQQHNLYQTVPKILN